MARPTKQGLDYFSFDVDFFEDDKIEFVTARFDEKGELITVKLLCNIYRNGYYTDWNDDKAIIFAKRAGKNISPSLVKDVVEELVKRGFFDRSIFNSFAVLTSRGIQKRYIKAISERKDVEIIREYWLIDIPKNTQRASFLIKHIDNYVTRTDNEVNHTDNEDKQADNPQSKVKESKVKKESYVATDVATKESSSKKTYERDSVEYKCSTYLISKILEINPRAKVPKTDNDIYKWCTHINRLIRIDKKPLDELRRVLKFAVTNNFWRAHILSTEKFREKYDDLYAQMHVSKGTVDASYQSREEIEKRDQESQAELERIMQEMGISEDDYGYD